MQSNDINLSSVPNDKPGVDRYGVTVSTQKQGPRSKLEKTLADDSSEEFILRRERETDCEKGRGIMVKTDVDVARHD